jgi:hypothetical protein
MAVTSRNIVPNCTKRTRQAAGFVQGPWPARVGPRAVEILLEIRQEELVGPIHVVQDQLHGAITLPCAHG